MKTGLVLAFLLSLPQCAQDETVSAYGAADRTWLLAEIDGTTFNATATLEFSDSGAIHGTGPCNRFSARQAAPYPWFEIRDLSVTRRACPDLKPETRFLNSLQKMTLAEVFDNTLILSTEDGRQMVFRSSD